MTADLMSYTIIVTHMLCTCTYTNTHYLFQEMLLQLMECMNNSNSCTDTDSDGRNQVHGKYYINTCSKQQQVVYIIHDLK